MISAGRLLTDPFEIHINYTIATGTEPDVKIASTNCHNSHVLLRNYELDTTNQAVRDELAQVRTDITMYENLIAFTQHVDQLASDGGAGRQLGPRHAALAPAVAAAAAAARGRAGRRVGAPAPARAARDRERAACSSRGTRACSSTARRAGTSSCSS